ncbi:SCO3374 family protein [Streptomyces formicae]|uniref:Putative proline-rich protein n=1 Tax=Streptomyces formicae TaxID=1616117 RepID=A0A291QDI1_9ACTN|nr:SCO3374 family protein [Streptomyces formicae]ATL29505.1 putative proline-rich protein [Streptomyces formicae]
MAPTVPQPRTPVEQSDPVRQWYENELGWATAPEPGPVRLLTGLRFDVLELPAEAGFAALRHLGPMAPVALRGETMRLLVSAGGADELPGLLDWLEWGSIPLGLTAVGAGGRIDAPTPPGWSGSRGAAVWLRPPEPGREVEPTLPALPSLPTVGGGGTVPHSDPAVGSDLVRLVDTAATQCHRVRLRRRSRQPLAFS